MSNSCQVCPLNQTNLRTSYKNIFEAKLNFHWNRSPSDIIGKFKIFENFSKNKKNDDFSCISLIIFSKWFKVRFCQCRSGWIRFTGRCWKLVDIWQSRWQKLKHVLNATVYFFDGDDGCWWQKSSLNLINKNSLSSK